MADNVIIQKIKAGEEQGLTMLMERYGSYVAAIVCNLSHEALRVEDVEEIAADVFLAVWNSGAKLRENCTLRPYLAQIARNTTLSRLRQNKPALIPLEEDVLMLSGTGGPDELTVKREKAEIINEVVGQFSEPDREIFIRFYFFGQPVRAIARKLAVNPSTVKTKLHRCRKKIKLMLEGRGYGCES